MEVVVESVLVSGDLDKRRGVRDSVRRTERSGEEETNLDGKELEARHEGEGVSRTFKAAQAGRQTSRTDLCSEDW